MAIEGVSLPANQENQHQGLKLGKPYRAEADRALLLISDARQWRFRAARQFRAARNKRPAASAGRPMLSMRWPREHGSIAGTEYSQCRSSDASMPQTKPIMPTAEERRQQANWCTELAETAEDAFAKEILIELAKEYSRDADRLERPRQTAGRTSGAAASTRSRRQPRP